MTPKGAPIRPPTTNGASRRGAGRSRSLPMVNAWAVSEPKITMIAAVCGSIPQLHTPKATRPKAKPETPETNAPAAVPATIRTICRAVI